MNNFNFNSRDTYIAFRKEWKDIYNDLSKKIRGLKEKNLEESRNGPSGNTAFRLHLTRLEANDMMSLLAAAKEESARQWASSRIGESA